ncbi:MAG: hypothetical protein GY866_19625 [Proteobacteria bacterium]|nr:hypothetical protein [Pseudomonadota bacterium]
MDRRTVCRASSYLCTKCFPLVLRKRVVTFGSSLEKFHPHLHALVSDGLFKDTQAFPISVKEQLRLSSRPATFFLNAFF